MNNLHCKKCCTSRSGDILGAPCRTTNCDGIIEEVPEFATLVDELPEPMTCGRRQEMGLHIDNVGSFTGAFKSGSGLDRWQKFKSNGNRVCSYCGSLHPQDMFALVKQAAEASGDAEYRTVVGIEPSTKGYKVYVNQPGVRNAHEGGIKFYMQHLEHNEDGTLAVTDEQQVEYEKAIRLTKERSNKRFEQGITV